MVLATRQLRNQPKFATYRRGVSGRPRWRRGHISLSVSLLFLELYIPSTHPWRGTSRSTRQSRSAATR